MCLCVYVDDVKCGAKIRSSSGEHKEAKSELDSKIKYTNTRRYCTTHTQTAQLAPKPHSTHTRLRTTKLIYSVVVCLYMYLNTSYVCASAARVVVVIG